MPNQPTSHDTAFPATGRMGGAGLVIRVRLVAPGSSRASGTFEAVGAIEGQGTAVAESVVPTRRTGTAPIRIDGAVRLALLDADLRLDVVALMRLVPDTSVLTGGGSWTIGAASGELDGLRAGGTLTALISYDDDRSAAVDLVLTGSTATRRPRAVNT